MLAVDHQKIPFTQKPYEVDATNPFFTGTIRTSAVLCGRCVEACQNVEVNETLSIHWEDPHPRVLWDGGKPIGESELRLLRPLRDRLPLQRAMESRCSGGRLHEWAAKPALNG